MQKKEIKVQLDTKRLVGFKKLPDTCTPEKVGGLLNKIGEGIGQQEKETKIHLDTSRLVGFKKLPDTCTPEKVGGLLNKIGEGGPGPGPLA